MAHLGVMCWSRFFGHSDRLIACRLLLEGIGFQVDPALIPPIEVSVEIRPAHFDLYLQHIPRPKPPDVVRCCKTVGSGGVELPNLRHDEFGLRWLGVCDVDGAWPGGVELCQFERQGLGGQMQGTLGQGAFAVAEGSFYHQHGHGNLIHTLPEGRVAPRVAAEYPPAAAALHRVAYGGTAWSAGSTSSHTPAA